MYTNRPEREERRDKKKSMRISAIVHIIILLLAILPFMEMPYPPPEVAKAILVEFKSGSSKKGAKRAAPVNSEKAERKETKVTESIQTSPPPPVLTSKTEPPIVPTKVENVKVKVMNKPTPLPKTKTEHLPDRKVSLEPTQVVKVKVEIEAPSSTGGGSGNSQSDASGTGGDGTSATGTADGNGQGNANSGSGDGEVGQGGGGSGDGNFQGDGILKRVWIEWPDLTDLIKENGTLSFNFCVNPGGKVVFAEYNSEHSTISDTEIVKAALSRAHEYKCEPKSDAMARECGLMKMNFKVEKE
jgi:hypothetical protein